ncbi:MAG: hemerythrin family protein [Magnetococcales bacterium]|nr:hemerythrin family protein [Magnetococcales bacterium]
MPIQFISRNKKPSHRWLRYPVTGIEAFDQHHQELLERMNALNEIMAKGGAGETALPLLNTLQTRFAVHFQDEEQRMLARGYGRFSSHAEDHQQFLAGPLAQVITQIGSGQTGCDLNTLIQWQASHISHYDRPMAAFLLAYS